MALSSHGEGERRTKRREKIKTGYSETSNLSQPPGKETKEDKQKVGEKMGNGKVVGAMAPPLYRHKEEKCPKGGGQKTLQPARKHMGRNPPKRAKHLIHMSKWQAIGLESEVKGPETNQSTEPKELGKENYCKGKRDIKRRRGKRTEQWGSLT